MKKITALVLGLIMAAFVFTGCASKNAVTVNVEQNGEVTLSKEYKTDAENLEELLVEKADELGATLVDSDYGKYIAGMNGYVASDDKHEYFELVVNGESAQTGASGVVIADGDVYLFRLTTY